METLSTATSPSLCHAIECGGRLLAYPRAAAEVKAWARVLADTSANPQLAEFARWADAQSDATLDEAYSSLFEVGAQACLYAGFHIFGLAYKRGMLLVDLNRALEQYCPTEVSEELSDHLSCVLVLAAAMLRAGDADGRGVLLVRECVQPVLERLKEVLGAAAEGYPVLIAGLHDWLGSHWSPIVWQLVEEKNDAHFLA